MIFSRSSNKGESKCSRFTTEEGSQIMESILFARSASNSSIEPYSPIESLPGQPKVSQEDDYTVVEKDNTKIKFKELG